MLFGMIDEAKRKGHAPERVSVDRRLMLLFLDGGGIFPEDEGDQGGGWILDWEPAGKKTKVWKRCISKRVSRPYVVRGERFS
jgi:hypothetical protein